MMPIEVLPGERYGRLTVLREGERHRGPNGKSVRRFWCECACGEQRLVMLDSLRNGVSRSCGCLRSELASALMASPRRPGAPRLASYVEAGCRFGKLTALEGASSGRDHVMCRCACGTERTFLAKNLMHPKGAKSCGCARAATLRSMSSRFVTHGMSHHPLYNLWRSMLDRTSNPKNRSYYRYGGRGIAVCERWQDVWNFVEDMERLLGPKPGPEYSIDRIDNDGNYEPGNVRWANAKTQIANRDVEWRPRLLIEQLRAQLRAAGMEPCA